MNPKSTEGIPDPRPASAGDFWQYERPLRLAPGDEERIFDDAELHREQDAEGCVRYRLYAGGPLHRDAGPAVIHNFGEEWYQHGRLHRDDGPAFVETNGAKRWYRDGRPHRDDGPAVEWEDGLHEYHRDGLLHRVDGPAVEGAHGGGHWFVNGSPRQPPLSLGRKRFTRQRTLMRPLRLLERDRGECDHFRQIR
jgi:hypothetical protein